MYGVAAAVVVRGLGGREHGVHILVVSHVVTIASDSTSYTSLMLLISGIGIRTLGIHLQLHLE
jgi:hypothetical protein